MCQLFPLDYYDQWKGKLLYSAVFSPQDRSKHFTLYFRGRSVHSDTISASLGNIQPYATINARRLLIHISTNWVIDSWVNWSNVEWTNLPKVLTPQNRIRTSEPQHSTITQELQQTESWHIKGLFPHHIDMQAHIMVSCMLFKSFLHL